MEIAKIKVTDVRAETVSALDIPCGIVGATVSFEFGPEWANLTKSVVFIGAKDVPLMNVENTVLLPAEVVAVPNINVKVGVVGVDADNKIVIPTLWADLGTVKHGAPVEMGYEPTLPVWAQLLVMIGNLRELDTEAKNNLVAAINEVLAKSGSTEMEIRLEYGVSKDKNSEPTSWSEDIPAIDAINKYLWANISVRNGNQVTINRGIIGVYGDTPDLSGYVKFVNGVKPDPLTGNVVVKIPEYTLPVAGENLGGVKNGGNVVINADGTMDVPGSGQNPAGGGMNATAQALLISILRSVHIYNGDQSANITALEAALASGGGGGTDVPDTPVEPDEPVVTTYTIVNVLTNVTNSNSATKATEGESYTATLTPADGYNLDTVTVIMGGVDVTADVYADGTITIENVTGNVIITASAVEDSATAPAFELTSPLVLGDTTDPRINDTAKNRIATGETVNDDEDWTICIDFTSLNAPLATDSTIYRNQNNQVSMGYSAPNWTVTLHAAGSSINDHGGKVDGVMHYAGKNMVVIATWDSVNKTYQTYGAAEYTKTFDSITTASSGQLSIGNASAIGTVNRFALYKRVLSADEITAWIGG